MQIFSVTHWVPWKGKVRGNDNHFKHGGKREGKEVEREGWKGRSRKGTREGEEWGITTSILWLSVGFDLFRQTATSYE